MKKAVALILFVASIALIFSACSGSNPQKGLVGKWEGGTELFSDGTCTVEGKYGTGKWVILEDNKLKITDFYGESYVVPFRQIDGEWLIGEEGWEYHKIK